MHRASIDSLQSPRGYMIRIGSITTHGRPFRASLSVAAYVLESSYALDGLIPFLVQGNIGLLAISTKQEKGLWVIDIDDRGM